MIDKRWARVKALFQAAVEQPPAERAAFLVGASDGDEALRREVESLLALDGADAGLLDRLPLLPQAVLADSRIVPPVLHPGVRLGPYEVVGPLGAGGMGEVYRARDIKLNRQVALKILPPEFAIDAERVVRFRREAQVLATLNHPNIGAIYGLEESPDVQALVLELIEGPTLADQIARGPIPLDRVLPIARQIAEALEAAHGHGIVHRDLKPSNVKVRADGIAKVLDFGLAKAVTTETHTEPAAAATAASRPTAEATRVGLILGTAAYMSPEQAKGQAVDRRTDIWSFGCVLFEMLSGRPPFRGHTVTDLLAAVVRDEPEWSALPAVMPPALQALLRRCLKRDPRQRLQAIGDARVELEAIEEILRGTVDASGVSNAPRATPVRRSMSWAALVVLAGGVLMWEMWRSVAPADILSGIGQFPLSNAEFTRFTDWEGTEASAAISPDGRFVAFIADRAGELDIWLSQVGTHDFRNLTANIPAMQPIGPTFRKMGFARDGADIWFTPESGPAMAQVLIPLMGGTPRAFLDKGATAPSWSPDGLRVTYFKNEDGDPLFVADSAGADARQILVQKGWHHHNPIWSTDGQWIYFARGQEPTESMDVWRIRPSGESLERMGEGATALNFVSPLDERTVLYIARANDGSGPWLWALNVESRMARRVGTGLGNYTSVSASRDGSRVVATVATPTANLWQVPLLDREITEPDVRPYLLPSTRALSPRFAGASLFYLSGRGTGDAVWRFQNGEATEVTKGPDGGLTDPPAVSKDGSRVAFISRRDGRRRLVIASTDGRTIRTLAPSLRVEGTAGQGAADWSPDGKWIVAGGTDDAQGQGLYKIPVDDGLPVRLVAAQAANPLWSPDGNLIVYANAFFTGQVELQGVRPDGAHVEMPRVRTRPGGYRFLPDGTGLVYLPFIPALDFWLFDFSSKTSRQLTRLTNQGALNNFDITPDGKTIVFDRSRENSDIVLIDVPR